MASTCMPASNEVTDDVSGDLLPYQDQCISGQSEVQSGGVRLKHNVPEVLYWIYVR